MLNVLVLTLPFMLRYFVWITKAASLADKVVEMKGMLIEELEAGIPESTNNQANTSTAGGSKYQQMLAKAKAEKEAK